MSTFGPAGSADDDEPDLTPFGELDYAATSTAQLHAALESAGYHGELVTDPRQLGAAELGARVERHTDGGGVAVVHVLSHGDHDDEGGVFVVGSDGLRGRRTRVEDWRIQVAADPAGPTTLFLLDLCHAGAANRHWQPPKRRAEQRAWVIAAAGADQPAYAGRLTRAAAFVIEEITSGRADLDPTLRWVEFDVLFERIRLRMRRLALDEAGHEQDPVCTPVMGAQPELPFFANPGYRPTSAGAAAAGVEAATARFVDPVLDEEHFRERAAGRGPARDRIGGGGFTGRAAQLRRLAAWMNGHDDGGPDGAAGLVVVTGSPGVGKSALLGVLVCAAHPQLREPTRELWRAAAARPSENAHLAAVHARQRGLDEITASLGRQLLGSDGALYPGPDLHPGEDVVPTAAHTSEQLIIAITRLPAPPVIVLDALDEALGAGQILERLLVPLAQARRPDGSAACRLLVGTRPWSEFAPLLDLARRSGEVLDLDTIPAEQRRADLTDYVGGLLELLPGYTGTAHSRGRRAFAAAVAAALVDEHHQPANAGSPSSHGQDRGQVRWGEFLVAALYTHTITLSDPDRLTDPATATALGAQVPRTLPEVMELDLGTRPDSPWRRPLLAVLARARGAGIPRAVLPAVLAALTDRPDPPSVEEVADELAALSFYLRTTADPDGTALYRLFHQGLADHLRTAPRLGAAPDAAADRILDGLVGTVATDSRGRRWDLAAPYLLRHVIQHATDAHRVDELLTEPGYLVHADPATLTGALSLARGPDARLAAAAYRVSTGQHAALSARQRCDVLAIDAARYGARHLLGDLSAVTPPARWRPRWATGSQVGTALRANLAGHTRGVTAVACTVLEGRPVAVTGGFDDTVRIWDLTTGTPIGDPLTGQTDDVTAVACTVLEGRPVAVTTGGHGDRTVRIWDLTTGTPIGDPLTGHTERVMAVACAVLEGRPVAVTGGFDGTVRIWDLTTGTPIGDPLTGHTGNVTGVACTVLEGRPVTVTGGFDGTVRIWDLTTGTPIGDPLTGHPDAVTGVACTVLEGRPVAVTTGGYGDGTVRIWGLTTAIPIGDPLTDHTGNVTGVACTEIDGRPVAVTGGSDRTVRIWDLTTGTPIGDPLTGHTDDVTAVACTVLEGRPVTVTTSFDDTVRMWDLTTATPIGDPLTGHTDDVTAVACTVLEGRPVAVTTSGYGDRTVRIWDLTTGTPIGDPLTGHTSEVTGVACTVLEGRPVAVTGGYGDGTVRIWDLTTATPIGEPLTGHTGNVTGVACTEIDGRPVAVTSGSDDTVRIWDLTTGTPIGDPLTGHTDAVTAVACTVLEGRPVAVTTGGYGDRTVRIWDLTTATPIGDPLTGHTRAVEAVACTVLEGRPVAVTGGGDSTVRIWDLTTGTPIGDPLTGHTGNVTGVACTEIDGRPVAVTSGSDSTVRIWDLSGGREIDRVDLPDIVNAVAVGLGGEIVVGFGWEIVVLDPTGKESR